MSGWPVLILCLCLGGTWLFCALARYGMGWDEEGQEDE